MSFCLRTADPRIVALRPKGLNDTNFDIMFITSYSLFSIFIYRALFRSWESTETPEQFTHIPGFEVESKTGLLSDFTRFLFEVVVWVFLCGSVSLVGIGTNIINLIVFIRQGILTESVTASLAGLAVADLCCVLTMFSHCIKYAILLSPPPGLSWDPLSVMYIASGWPRIMFTRVTCWITAYVALERCMCVVLPFKVKQLFTARRSVIVIGTIFVFIIGSYVPIFYTQRLKNVFDPNTNATKLRMVFTADKEKVEFILRHTNDIIFPTLSLSIVILCTQLTIARLNASKKWRKKNANSGNFTSETGTEIETQNNSNKQADSTVGKSSTTVSATTKETKVVKMITLICVIFIICNSPCVILFYVQLMVPEMANNGRYHNLFFVVYSVDFLLETINSSINILVYYKMSTKYKQEFRRLFGLRNDNI